MNLGKKAPAFTLLSDTEEKISLKDFLGKTVVLYFYPKDMTPGCTEQACNFRDQFDKFRKNKIIILGISRDPVSKHQKFKEKYTLPFPLLSDEDGKVCETYGVWKEKSLYGKKFMGIVRTTFVISPEGNISNIYSKVKVKNHINQILKDLDI